MNITLVNPLSKEERLQVTRLLAHDFSAMYNVCNGFGNLPPYSDYAKHALHIAHTIYLLCNLDDIVLLGNSSDLIQRQDFGKFLRTIQSLSNGRIDIDFEHRDFLTAPSILHTVITNLAKNSLKAQPEGNVIVRADYVSGFPENVTYTPDGARDYSEFIALRVLDKGKGFQKDKPL
ncbi:MAG TPA: hypothetical protein VFF28_01260 [Candidatus Nanoarchaeia archaeon]|nr:hypothetical protein [Candidatus Nanoarchaeia archaeon]